MRLWSASPDRQRRWALERVADGPLHDYLSVPLPPWSTPVEELPLLAVDLETTGFDPASDAIISIGFVPVDGGVVRLGGARRIVVRTNGAVGQSATIHGLTDDVVADGIPLDEALGQVLPALAGRALLAHHALIEMKFLSMACKRLYGHRLPVVRVDTMLLQLRIVAPVALDRDPPEGSLRLWNARDRFGLPAFRAHDALADALACAELYLAQRAELGHDRELTLRDLR